jgi:SAM-dependent methyltransferase
MPPVRKWWIASPTPTDAREMRRELTSINATAAVPIEIAGADQLRATGTSNGGSADVTPGPVKERFLKEAHHRQYGRPWAMGKYLFEFVVAAGLEPHHRLLDFGCGALRLGNWAIPYLDAGNYFGVDSHLVSLEAAATYEIPLHGLEAKRPRLLWDENFAFSHFGTTFDYVVDFSSSSRVKDRKQLRRLFGNFADVLEPGGRLLTAPRPGLPIEDLAQLGLSLVRGDVLQRCPLLEGHDESFKTTNVWFEFARA